MAAPQSNFSKNGLGPDDIKDETERLINQANQAAEIKENKFPVEVFPLLFQDLIIECNRSLNFPTDYTGTAILSAISTAIGKSAKLKVKSGWYEFAAFYVALIGNSGVTKSHPIDLAFKPFGDIDWKALKEYEQKGTEYDAFQKLNKKEQAKQSEPPKPILIKTILNNFTPEILYQRLNDNKRGCTIVSEELPSFLEGMNNYSKRDQTSIYLSFWSNKPTSVDRVSKPPLWLPQPFLNIIGSIQPRVLQKSFPPEKSDNGFLQRFLFAFPNHAEKLAINDIEINEAVVAAYKKWILSYIQASPIEIDVETGKANAKLYHWSNDAKLFFYEWQRKNTEKVNENVESLKGEILSKYDIHFARLSLVLQIMLDYQTTEISLQAVQGAEKLCTYFQRCAMKVLDILENENPLDKVPTDKRKLYEGLPDVFTTKNGIQIAASLGVPKDTFNKFLRKYKKELFEQRKVGEWEKLY